MAKLGKDFNSSEPTESAYVRSASSDQLATLLRDLKSRIKSFFGVVFDPDSAQLKTSTVPHTALAPLSPDPAGVGYRRFTVDRKGRIIAGNTTPPSTAPRPFRAVFTTAYGRVDRESGFFDLPKSKVSFPHSGYPLLNDSAYVFSADKYLFVVPEGVNRVRYHLVGSGEGADQQSTPNEVGEGASAVEGTMKTIPGEVLEVFVAYGTPTHSGGASKAYGYSFIMSEDKTRLISNFGQILPGVAEMQGMPLVLPAKHGRIQSGSYYSDYGYGGELPTNNGNDGLIILDWYA